MKQQEGPVVLAQRVFNKLNRIWALALGMLLLLMGSTPALPGHFGQFVAIGYSEQARYFSFEEFGLLSEDGTAYSTIHVIDVVQSRPVLGTPIRIELHQSEGSLADARVQALQAARQVLENLHIQRPASIVAFAADGQSGEAHTLSFGVPLNRDSGEVIGNYILNLREFDTLAASPCDVRSRELPQGFALELSDGENSAPIFEDGLLPRSRGCPVSYRIGAVLLPFGSTDLLEAISILSVREYGTEGIKRSFFAVPLGVVARGQN